MFEFLSTKEKMKIIRFHYPKARVSPYAQIYFVVDTGVFGQYLGAYKNSPEKAINAAWKTVRYN